MSHLKTLDDIDQVFQPDIDDLFFVPSSLPEWKQNLIDCWKCYLIVPIGYDGDYEKEAISPSTYNAYTSSKRKKFNYDCIEKVLGIPKFKASIQKVVREYLEGQIASFKSDFEYQPSDTHIKLFVKENLNDIEDSFHSLVALNGNKFQSIVIEQFLRAYLIIHDEIRSYTKEFFPEYIKSFQSQYEDLVKSFEVNFDFVNELDEYVFRDNQDSFLQYEKLLVKKGFLDESLIWQKSKNNLIRYYQFIESKRYFKKGHNKHHLFMLRKLSDRYSIKLGKQTNPNRIKNLPPKNDLFDFLEDTD